MWRNVWDKMSAAAEFQTSRQCNPLSECGTPVNSESQVLSCPDLGVDTSNEFEAFCAAHLNREHAFRPMALTPIRHSTLMDWCRHAGVECSMRKCMSVHESCIGSLEMKEYTISIDIDAKIGALAIWWVYEYGTDHGYPYLGTVRVKHIETSKFLVDIYKRPNKCISEAVFEACGIFGEEATISIFLGKLLEMTKEIRYSI